MTIYLKSLTTIMQSFYNLTMRLDRGLHMTYTTNINYTSIHDFESEQPKLFSKVTYDSAVRFSLIVSRFRNN